MYFLTPRKCAIFGVCCEAIPRQVNYLIDEAVDMGKGAVVSMLHHFLQVLSEKDVHLHTDNCESQNNKQDTCCGARSPGSTASFYDSWPHEILTRLVLLPPEEEVRNDCFIIESVDSTSRDGPTLPYLYVIQNKMQKSQSISRFEQ